MLFLGRLLWSLEVSSVTISTVLVEQRVIMLAKKSMISTFGDTCKTPLSPHLALRLQFSRIGCVQPVQNLDNSNPPTTHPFASIYS